MANKNLNDNSHVDLPGNFRQGTSINVLFSPNNNLGINA